MRMDDRLRQMLGAWVEPDEDAHNNNNNNKNHKNSNHHVVTMGAAGSSNLNIVDVWHGRRWTVVTRNDTATGSTHVYPSLRIARAKLAAALPPA